MSAGSPTESLIPAQCTAVPCAILDFLPRQRAPDGRARSHSSLRAAARQSRTCKTSDAHPRTRATAQWMLTTSTVTSKAPSPTSCRPPLLHSLFLVRILPSVLWLLNINVTYERTFLPSDELGNISHTALLYQKKQRPSTSIILNHSTYCLRDLLPDDHSIHEEAMRYFGEVRL
eukprot:3386122-Pleurochrysis_carterae.AAC.3